MSPIKLIACVEQYKDMHRIKLFIVKIHFFLDIVMVVIT